MQQNQSWMSPQSNCVWLENRLWQCRQESSESLSKLWCWTKQSMHTLKRQCSHHTNNSKLFRSIKYNTRIIRSRLGWFSNDCCLSGFARCTSKVLLTCYSCSSCSSILDGACVVSGWFQNPHQGICLLPGGPAFPSAPHRHNTARQNTAWPQHSPNPLLYVQAS